MKEKIELPHFVEDRFITSKPVYLAKYSRDGKLMAVVHADYSLSIWDGNDILVNTFEQNFFAQRSPNNANSFHIIFLDWSASNRYLYFIADCVGFFIDIYGSKKETRSFTFDQPLNSFSAHPTEDMLCLVTCLDKLIELNIQNDSPTNILNYRDRFRPENSKKTVIPSYAQYTGIDDTILLWVQGYLCLVSKEGVILNELQLKSSMPSQQRLSINQKEQTCVVARRNELVTLSLPSLKPLSYYRDPVNDSAWRCVESLSSQKLVMAMPDNYVLDGPVFYLMPPQNDVDVVIYREPKQRVLWGILHPSGRSILFCTDRGDLLIYRNESWSIPWHVGPMYPYRFTYLKKNEQGPTTVEPEFESTYFPPNDHGMEWSNCKMTHAIDLVNDAPEEVEVLPMHLVAEDPEKEVLQSVNVLPPPYEDIYGNRYVCLLKESNEGLECSTHSLIG